jgi:hypothetical protein
VGELAEGLRFAAARIREQALAGPAGAEGLIDALEEAGLRLGELERRLRLGQVEGRQCLEAALRAWADELGRMELLVHGAMELAGGWSVAAGLAAGYGPAGPVAARPARVDEVG